MRASTAPLLLLAFLASLVGLAGCQSAPGEPSDWQPFTGEVVWVTVERGFWGIKADKLGRINPVELPVAFQQDGLRLQGELRLRPDMVSMKMWGTISEIRNLAVAP